MGVRAGQGYGSTKPKRGVCPACTKKGVKGWRANGGTGMMIRECQYCCWNECITPKEYEQRLVTKASHGGPGRGQGRKPVKEGEPTISTTLRMTKPQREKLGRLGGAEWIRDRIDETPEPTKISGE